MAKNILEFPNAGILGENDFIHVIQNGVDKKATFKLLPEASDNSNGLLPFFLFNILKRLTIFTSNGSGAGISGVRGMSLIMAYQKSNMANFCIYMTIKKYNQMPHVYTLNNNGLTTGAKNPGGTIVVNGANEEDIVQIAFRMDAEVLSE